LLKQRTKSVSDVPDITVEKPQPIVETAGQLAANLFKHNSKKRKLFFNNLQEIYSSARSSEILVIHSPGGWGNANWDNLQDWEKSIVTGVTATLEKLGYSYIMKQYFRSGDELWGRPSWIREGQFFLFGKSFRAEVFATELKFLTANLPQLKIILVGASQGAAFDNKVLMEMGANDRVYSIELGTFFAHMRRRQLTGRNLAIDNNGFMKDPMCQRDLWQGTKSYFRAFVRWFNYKMQGKPVKFTNCINTPGHEYQWEFPAVKGRITKFLNDSFGEKH
jgi:hypothetical protein